MKKYLLLFLLLTCGVLLTWCFEKENECIIWETCGEWLNGYIEERTKILDENPWDWANKEKVYPTEWLKTLDSWIWNYPSESDDWIISRFAIYDRENHKWLFDCFDWWGGWYIEVDESIDIDSVDVMSCKEKYDEAINYIWVII